MRRDFCAQSSQPAAGAPPCGESYSTVFWDPAHGSDADLLIHEMLSIKVSTLFAPGSLCLACLGHGSVLQDLNFILRPIQYLPPFLGPDER